VVPRTVNATIAVVVAVVEGLLAEKKIAHTPCDIAQPQLESDNTFLSHTMSSKRKLISHQASVFSAVEGNHELLDLLEIATTTARKNIFIESLLKINPTAFDLHDTGKTSEDLFILFTTWFGSFDQSKTTKFPGITAAVRYKERFFLELRYQKRQFIRDIGLNWTAVDKSSYFSKVNSLSALVEKSSFLPRLRLSMFPS
jgi:hypothetical protein